MEVEEREAHAVAKGKSAGKGKSSAKGKGQDAKFGENVFMRYDPKTEFYYAPPFITVYPWSTVGTKHDHDAHVGKAKGMGKAAGGKPSSHDPAPAPR